MSQKREFHNLDDPSDGLFRELAKGLVCAAGPMNITAGRETKHKLLRPTVAMQLTSQSLATESM
jgi:hypothetical protein